MTQGRIECWHQTLKNRILLENYFLPGDPEARIAAFIDDYNHRRFHESINNLTPQMSIAGTALLSSPNDKRSSDKPLSTADFSTTYRPPDITTSIRQSLP
jgi:hypothetical protein